MKKGTGRTAYLHYEAYTCPACGYTKNMPNWRKIKKMNEEFGKMSKIIQFQIKTVSKAIQKHLPSEANDDIKFKFIARIKQYPDEAIFTMIEKFMKTEEYAKGHGFLYLAGMIKNYEQNKKNIKEMDRKKYGKTAPYVNLKELYNE